MALARQKYWHIRTNLTRPLLYNYNLNSNYKDYSKNLLASLTCLVFLQSLSLVVAERRYLGFYAEVLSATISGEQEQGAGDLSFDAQSVPLWYSIAHRIDLHDCHAISARRKNPEESATIFPPVHGLAQIHAFAISDEFVDAHLPVRKCFRLLRAIVIPAPAKKT